MDIVQPVPSLLVQIPAVVDDHHIQRPLRQEAAVHGMHILLTAEVPEVDLKFIRSILMGSIRLDADTQSNIRADVVIIAFVQDALDGVGLACTAIAQEDDLGFPNGNFGCIVVGPDGPITFSENTDGLGGEGGTAQPKALLVILIIHMHHLQTLIQLSGDSP